MDSTFTFSVHPDVIPKEQNKKMNNVHVHKHLRRKNLDKKGQKLVRYACSHGTEDSSSKELILESIEGISNPFVAACTMAFDKHLPLTLRPQHFWLCITQAVAMHVEDNSESLREKFVSHDGKKVLELYVDNEASNGFTQTDWENVVSRFDVEIRKHTKDGVVEYLGCSEFSNTTATENIASMMTCMDIMKSYFEYKCSTCCGFPSITLEGTVEDWRHLKRKTEWLIKNYTLKSLSEKWLPILTDVLDRFILTREGGEIDVEFWESFVKRGSTYGSGGYTWISGWINVFFPFEEPGKLNPFCEKFVGGDQYTKYVKDWCGNTVPEQKGLENRDFPNGLSNAPVSLDGVDLSFCSGFIGVKQFPNGGLIPEVGWFVAAGTGKKENYGGLLEPVLPDTKYIKTTIGVAIPLLDYVEPPYQLRKRN